MPGALLVQAFFCPLAGQAQGIEIQLVTVTDGDTLVVRLRGEKDKVRLLGIDTPESRENAKLDRDAERLGLDRSILIGLGKRATAHMHGLLTCHRLGLRFPDPMPKRDRYGRLLAYLDCDGMDLNARMLADGYAWPYRKAHHPRQGSYEALYTQAARAHLGLWAEQVLPPDTPTRKAKGKRH